MATQGRVWETNLVLLSSGTPATGLTFSDLTVQYRKMGDTSLTTKTLVAEDFVEIGGGLYVLKWSEEDMNTLGSFYFTITGAGFDGVTREIEIFAATVGSLISPTSCIITGNISDLGGDPGQGAEVMFRLAKRPSANTNAFILAEPVRTNPDVYGTFSVVLVRGVKVVVEIPKAGLRHLIEVPDQESANLIDLLPPIDNLP